MIELVEMGPAGRGGVVIELVDYRTAEDVDLREELAPAYVADRVRWNDLAHDFSAPELTEALMLVAAWRAARQAAATR